MSVRMMHVRSMAFSKTYLGPVETPHQATETEKDFKYSAASVPACQRRRPGPAGLPIPHPRRTVPAKRNRKSVPRRGIKSCQCRRFSLGY